MPSDPLAIDITDAPEVSRLVDEARRTRRPWLLRRANENVAMLTPLPPPADEHAGRHRMTRAEALAVVARTAGALRGEAPFPGIDAERAAAEQAMAEEAEE